VRLRAHAPADLDDDIEQEAIVLLARNFRRTADLGIDRVKGGEHFAGWLATIIEHDCGHGLAIVGRARRKAIPVSPDIEATAPKFSIEEKLDLNQAVANLPEPKRTVVALYLDGCSLAEIAARLGMSYWQANQALRTGLGTVVKGLRPRCDPIGTQVA
jgi:RNA polymerase sigma factor (sigma-70 family)